MRKLIHLLFNQSLKDLFKYKSFFLLIFVLVLVDRLLKIVSGPRQGGMEIPRFDTLGVAVAEYVFNDLPGKILSWITDYRTLLIIILLFLMKQLISMWPSSDMRRMHRQEREQFGLLASLVAIHGRQVLWDALAVGTIVLVTGVWIAISYSVGAITWHYHQMLYSLFIFAALSGLILPITMAGFSFSSKLAVISKGSFREKLTLYFKLLTNFKVFLGAWLFFTFRLAIEGVFVVVLPLAVLWTMDNALLRIAIAGIIATPFYSFLKMASFKFFLYIYQPYELVQNEYQVYYEQFHRQL